VRVEQTNREHYICWKEEVNMDISLFDYDLPGDLIPQTAPRLRGTGRLLVVHRGDGAIEHRSFSDFPSYLRAGDVLVLNDTRVIHTVLVGTCEDGAQVQVQLVSNRGNGRWDCHVVRVRPLQPGSSVSFADGALTARVVGQNSHGTGTLMDLSVVGNDLLALLERYGRYMLPLYLSNEVPEDGYQTVYANREGSVQPPVAGMHFSESMLDHIRAMGVHVLSVTLHIGRLDNLALIEGGMPIEAHRMYDEAYEVKPSVADTINTAHAAGSRIIAIGTTVTRTLEFTADENGVVHSGSGWTNHYIYPGYTFKVVDVLMSNLQPPRTTNLFLACSFGGTKSVMNAYREAVAERYQFLEFGDCVLYI
jgi:S-adenosylmethionine:tRNA ribosyltransferase-isomerase